MNALNMPQCCPLVNWNSVIVSTGPVSFNKPTLDLLLSMGRALKGRVERIFFFASFKLPLFNEYGMVFIIA